MKKKLFLILLIAKKKYLRKKYLIEKLIEQFVLLDGLN